MSFEKALEKVLVREGGYVNNPVDRGGPTNKGITIHTLSDYIGRTASIEEIQYIEDSTVEDIYRAKYWDKLALDFIDYEPLAHALFDQAINRGVRQVAKEIQRLVNVKDDGFVGALTLAAINEKLGRDLTVEFVKKSQLYYCRLVKNDPSQSIFLDGWMKRTHELLEGVV